MMPGAGRPRYARSHAPAGPPAPRSVAVERRQPVHRVARRRPDPAGRGRGPPVRPAPGRPAGSGPPGAAHLGADQGHPHRRPGPGGGRTDLAPGPPALAAQRTPLRGPPGPQQEGDHGQVRGGPGQGVAPQLRHPAAARRAREPTPSGRRPPLPGRAGRGAAGHRVPGRRGGPGPSLLVRRHRARPAGRGPRGGAVLVVAHGNSLRALRKHIDGIGDDDIVGLEIPTGIPYRLPLGRRPVGGVGRLSRRSRGGPGRRPRRSDARPADHRPDRSATGGGHATRERDGGPAPPNRPSVLSVPKTAVPDRRTRLPAQSWVRLREPRHLAHRCGPAPPLRRRGPRPCRHRSCRCRRRPRWPW